MQFGENRFPVEIADDGAAASAFLEEVRLQEMIVKTVIKTVIKMLMGTVVSDSENYDDDSCEDLEQQR